MHILLLSDVHLGVKRNSDFFLKTTRDFFDTLVVQTIKKYNVQQLWVLGDYFDDKYRTDVLVDNVGIRIIKKLLYLFQDLQIKFIVGNHDIYYKNSLKISSLKKFEKVNRRVEVINTVKEFDLDGCKTLAVPWLIHNSENWINFQKILKAYTSSHVQQYDLCMGHFEINGFEVVKNTVMKSGLNQESFKAFGDVFSGHFHIRAKQGNIQYLGCPFELTWNDYNTKKGITVYDTKKRKATFIENIQSPIHKKITLSEALKDPTILEDSHNNLVQFYIDESIDESALADILTKLDTNKPFNIKIIDERFNIIDNDDVELDDLLTSDALQYALDYIDQCEHPKELNIDMLKTRTMSYFNRASSENE
jgi:DNA repair exonuclease SbcCD nuclease subunit